MKKFMKKYGFITLMLLGIVAGCVVGAVWPGATALEPFGTLFINMMFCVVVPMVFCSIASAIANMSSAKRAGRIMGITVGTFFSTAAIAAIVMYIIVRFIPVFTAAPSYEETSVGTVDIGTLIVNFFTKPDFTELWSRRAILPLIVAAIIFGIGIQMSGGRESRVALLLNDLTDILLKVIRLISFYAPVGFFGFFASLVATHGSDFVSNYARAIGIYYIVSVIYLLISSPLYARFGGGEGAAKVMFRHIFRPAATAFGTCSSVATIPVNMEVSKETGISKEVSDIGSAMSAIIKVAFLFGMFGKDFGTGEAILAIVVAVFSSVAMSGIPGGGGTGELVLCSMFFPEHLSVAFPIALAIGELIDPPATMVNAAGDYVVSFIVSRFVDGKDWLQKKLHGAKTDAVSE